MFFLKKWRGQLKLKCSSSNGSNIVKLINDATTKGITLSKLSWHTPNEVTLYLSTTEIWNFIKLARNEKIKVRVTDRIGIAFTINRILKMRSLIAGLVCANLLILLLSNLILNINIKIETTNEESISKESINIFLKEAGIYTGLPKLMLPDTEGIKQKIISKFPQVAWVGINTVGTQLKVTVVEKKLSIRSKDKEEGPVNFIAKKNALISRIEVERGNLVVKVNDTVTRGKLLVSGQYGDLQNPNNKGKVVGAKGKVWGEVWYEVNIKVPLKYEYKIMTGNKESHKRFFISNNLFGMPFSSPDYDNYVTIHNDISSFKFWDFELPIGFLDEEYLETETNQFTLTEDAAIDYGIESAYSKLLEKLEPGSKILKHQVISCSTKNNKVNLKLKINSLENIAKSQPILK